METEAPKPQLSPEDQKLLAAVRAAATMQSQPAHSISRLVLGAVLTAIAFTLIIIFFWPHGDELKVLDGIQPPLQDGSTPTNIYDQAKADFEAAKGAGAKLDQHDRTLERAIDE